MLGEREKDALPQPPPLLRVIFNNTEEKTSERFSELERRGVTHKIPTNLRMIVPSNERKYNDPYIEHYRIKVNLKQAL
ncbi:MAG: hypothetical protein AAF518_16420, partial [Spirochaetota bacterium]